MCGFIGRIVPAGVSPLRPLTAGLPWLARRGPDSQNLWRSPTGDSGQVELLHARLAIVDFTERAHQPLWHRGRRVAIVFNGEVYNHGEVRAGFPDFDFTTESDTEVILAAYLTGGLAALRHLKGMFTAAVCDVAERRVHLMRDAVGKKPLFVARWGGQILFGSSLLPLVAAAGTRPAIDDAAAARFWQRAFPAPDTTMLAGARPLPPGTVTTLDFAGNALGTRMLRPEVTARYDGENAEDVRVRVDELIEGAVAARLQNNPKAGGAAVGRGRFHGRRADPRAPPCRGAGCSRGVHAGRRRAVDERRAPCPLCRTPARPAAPGAAPASGRRRVGGPGGSLPGDAGRAPRHAVVLLTLSIDRRGAGEEPHRPGRRRRGRALSRLRPDGTLAGPRGASGGRTRRTVGAPCAPDPKSRTGRAPGRATR